MILRKATDLAPYATPPTRDFTTLRQIPPRGYEVSRRRSYLRAVNHVTLLVLLLLLLSGKAAAEKIQSCNPQQIPNNTAVTFEVCLRNRKAKNVEVVSETKEIVLQFVFSTQPRNGVALNKVSYDCYKDGKDIQNGKEGRTLTCLSNGLSVTILKDSSPLDRAGNYSCSLSVESRRWTANVTLTLETAVYPKMHYVYVPFHGSTELVCDDRSGVVWEKGVTLSSHSCMENCYIFTITNATLSDADTYTCSNPLSDVAVFTRFVLKVEDVPVHTGTEKGTSATRSSGATFKPTEANEKESWTLSILLVILLCLFVISMSSFAAYHCYRKRRSRDGSQHQTDHEAGTSRDENQDSQLGEGTGKSTDKELATSVAKEVVNQLQTKLDNMEEEIELTQALINRIPNASFIQAKVSGLVNS